MSRPKIPKDKQAKVLSESRHRCAICFGLYSDTKQKKGQIAHLDRNPANNAIANLVFLCLDHHDDYDSTTSQSKNYTQAEVKTYRRELYTFLKKEKLNVPWPEIERPRQGGQPKSSGAGGRKAVACSPEVYDRRLPIYESTQSFLGAVISNAAPTVAELFAFARGTDHALFLFDQPLADYLRELYEKGVRLHFLREAIDPAKAKEEPQRKAYIEEDYELLLWFSDQLRVSRERFLPYLSLEGPRPSSRKG